MTGRAGGGSQQMGHCEGCGRESETYLCVTCGGPYRPDGEAWEVSECRCSYCGHAFVSAHPAGVSGLECPECGIQPAPADVQP